MEEKNEFLGIIKWFDQEKGFGVVLRNSSEEYFLHKNQITGSSALFHEGVVVVFEPSLDQKRNRQSAKNAELFSKPEHWIDLASLLKSYFSTSSPNGEAEDNFPKIAYSAAIQFAGANPSAAFISGLKEVYSAIKPYLKFEWFANFSENVIFKSFSNHKANEFLRELTELYVQNLDLDILFESWTDKKLNKFWEGNHRIGIVQSYIKSIDSNITDDDRFELFLKGLYPHISLPLLEERLFSLASSQIEQVVRSKFLSNDFSFQLFPQLINQFPDLGIFLVDFAKANFPESLYLDFEGTLSTSLSEKTYLELWFKNKVKFLEGSTLKAALKENKPYHEKVIGLANEGIISLDEIKKILIENIDSNPDPNNRSEFKTLELSLVSLNNLDPSFLNTYNFPENKNIELILWVHFDHSGFDFETLKKKFIYFCPEKQVEIIKRLFHMKAIGLFDLTVEKLISLSKFDLDLFLINQKENPEIPIDISTDLIIKLLDSIQRTGEFYFESDLLTIVLQDLLIDQTKKFKFDHYFEKCQGRMEAKKDESNGVIERKPYKDKYYFQVEIYFEINRWKWNPDPNPIAFNILQEIKNLPGSKYNQEEEYWGVPGKYAEHIYQIAKKYSLEVYGTNDDSEINSHIIHLVRTKKPNGITFCEGRFTNKKDNTLKKEFWWCNGLPCLQNCETNHSPNQWSDYTLLDFLKLLDVNCDEIDSNGKIISNGKFYKFISTVNRFNELLEKLYCKDCDHILHPLKLGNFGARNVTQFHCVNEKCNNEEVVYLNNCLNGKCKNIVDSRDSKTCPNGLYVCDKCGCCCSHAQMVRRYGNLKMTGGSIGKSFENSVSKKLGHLERMVFFCYKCGNNMENEGKNTTKLNCKNCKVEYDLKHYGFKFPHIGLPKEPTDFAELKKPPHDSEEDMPF
jgi:cold shock CspA family protein